MTAELCVCLWRILARLPGTACRVATDPKCDLVAQSQQAGNLMFTRPDRVTLNLRAVEFGKSMALENICNVFGLDRVFVDVPLTSFDLWNRKSSRLDGFC